MQRLRCLGGGGRLAFSWLFRNLLKLPAAATQLPQHRLAQLGSGLAGSLYRSGTGLPERLFSLQTFSFSLKSTDHHNITLLFSRLRPNLAVQVCSAGFGQTFGLTLSSTVFFSQSCSVCAQLGFLFYSAISKFLEQEPCKKAESKCDLCCCMYVSMTSYIHP